MAAVAVVGVGMMMMCCSSSVAAVMMSGEEKKDDSGGGGGGGGGGGADDDSVVPKTPAQVAADTAYIDTIRNSTNGADRAAAAAAKAQADADAAAAALAADPAADPVEVAAAEAQVTTAKTYAELGCERCHHLMHCPSNECFGCYGRNLQREGCPQTW